MERHVVYAICLAAVVIVFIASALVARRRARAAAMRAWRPSGASVQVRQTTLHPGRRQSYHACGMRGRG